MNIKLIPKPSNILENCDHITVYFPNMSYSETLTDYLISNIDESCMTNSQREQWLSTGYSFNELRNIESSFEGHAESSSKTEDEWIFKGLMSVVDELMHIHEANEEEIKVAKSLFVKELTL